MTSANVVALITVDSKGIKYNECYICAKRNHRKSKNALDSESSCGNRYSTNSHVKRLRIIIASDFSVDETSQPFLLIIRLYRKLTIWINQYLRQEEPDPDDPDGYSDVHLQASL